MTFEARIARLLNSEVRRVSRLHGGDLSVVQCVDFANGQRVVAKTGPKVDIEGRMLHALGTAGAPVPKLLHSETGLILLEFLDEMPAGPAGWRFLGTALRELHGTTGANYGWIEDYAFGNVPIPNMQAGNWPEFWAKRRLLSAPDALPADIRKRVEALAAQLPDLLPPDPAPALLHGDLWAGNVLFHGPGRAALIDPACYFGDAEVDLAMLTLFGSPTGLFWEAYGQVQNGYIERRSIYQLWPALVHLRLFGAGYRAMVARLLDQAGF